MSKNPQALRLLIRYIVSEATDKEKQKIEQWLKKDITHQQLLRSLEQLLHESQLDLAQWNEDELWNKFASKAGIALSQAESPDEIKLIPDTNISRWLILSVMHWCFGINRSSSQYVFRLAVIAILILGGAIGTAVYFKQLQQKRELAYQSTYQEYSTQKGERSKLLLSDGTSIHLNSATKVRFPIVFAKEKREVFLDGEGFFEVARNESSPFTVQTANANIRVLGTIFNVTSYSEDNKTQVVVSEGQVAFAGIQQQDVVLLNRNQMSRIIKGGHPTTAEVIRTDKYLAWLKNQMVFENATLAEVIKQLSRKYDVVFEVHDPELLSRHIVATYGNESLSQIIRSLSFSLRFQYEQRGKVVSLYRHRDSKAL
ncbi:MAG: FecR domain-containing protein [Ignavibacteriales bacterium]|nr:FecR domain-containing protein [Ignavibacteriales bacterium]